MGLNLENGNEKRLKQFYGVPKKNVRGKADQRVEQPLTEKKMLVVDLGVEEAEKESGGLGLGYRGRIVGYTFCFAVLVDIGTNLSKWN